jgi:hypothetical protein
MSSRIGFVLLTHARPAQIDRLTRRLAASFPGAPIVCHHDFSRAAIDRRAYAALYDRVEFVRPSVRTAWAEFSVIEAYLAALRQITERPSAPDWVTLLSGADYPLRDAPAVLADLDGGGFDAYLHHVAVDPRPEPVRGTPPAPPLGYSPGEGPANQELCALRYFGWVARFPGVPGVAALRPRRLLVRYPAVTDRLTPFGDSFRCYAGSLWHTLGRRAAAYLLETHAARPRLRRHFARRAFSDEAYLQTVLCNAPGLRVSPNTFRYVDWRSGNAHPATLTERDLPDALASGAHFARKFDPDASAAALDALDAHLDGAARVGASGAR